MQRTPSSRLLLALAVVCALAAAALAGSNLDRPAFFALNGAADRWLGPAIPSCLTILGHGLVAVMLLAPFLERAPQALAAGLFAAPLGGAFSTLLKRLFAEPRPAAVLDTAQFHVQGTVLAGHNSFPSGHSITIFLVASVLLLGADDVRSRPLAIFGVLGLAALVAASRVMVGAHWPADAIGGAALGIVAGVMGNWAAHRLPIWNRSPARIVLALIVIACAVALAVADTGYPQAVPMQWAAVVLGAIAAMRTLILRLGHRRETPGP